MASNRQIPIYQTEKANPDRLQKSVGVISLFSAVQFFIRIGVLRTPAVERSSPLPSIR